MKLTILTVFLSVGIIAKIAHADLPGGWESVEFETIVRFEDGDVSEKVVVSIKGREKLDKLELLIAGESIRPDETAFEGILFPELNTAELIFGWFAPEPQHNLRGVDNLSAGGKPFYSLRFRFGREAKFGELAEVRFLFFDGKFQSRTIRTPISENGWSEVIQKSNQTKNRTKQEGKAQPANGPKLKEEDAEEAQIEPEPRA